MEDKLRKIFANVLKISESEVSDSTSRENTVEWDSLNHLMLLTEIEKDYKIKFTASDTLKMGSFKKISDFLKQKGF